MCTSSLRIASAASMTASSPPPASSTRYATDTRFLYKRRITSRYTSFTTLKSFLDVNYSGLRNILKKCDQVTYGDLPASWRADHFVDVLEGPEPAR
ncbi:hypothetical protein GGG16DRAFT_126989 [Schizophyllum commune]